MNLILLFIGLNAGFLSPGADQHQSADTLATTPPIEEVTVYLEGAQITHTTTLDLPQGRHTLVFSGLNPSINSQTSTVGFDGDSDVEILSVNHTTRQVENPENSGEISRLTEEKESLERNIRDVRIDLDVISYEQNMLQQNIRPEDADAATLRELLALHRERVRDLQSQSAELNDSLNTLRTRVNEINQILRQPDYQTHITEGELVVEVENSGNQTVGAHISYPVSKAGWLPEYDLHVDAMGEPLRSRLSASIYNNSMQDWTDVNLVLSTQTPEAGIDNPEISPWFLDYNNNTRIRLRGSSAISASTKALSVSGRVTDAESGDPIDGALIRVANMQIGTQTDSNGRYALQLPEGAARLVANMVGYRSQAASIDGSVINFQMQQDAVALSEVVVTGYGDSDEFYSVAQAPPSVRTEQLVSREFVIRDQQSIPSDGDTHRIRIEETSTDADFAYLAIPKINKNAVLKADVTDWESLFPLAGTAMLHLEGTYVGETYINPTTAADTLQLSFGKDEGIVVSRTKQRDRSDKSFFRNRVTRTMSHEISVRNSKAEPVNIEVMDQIPISMRDEIEVSARELSGGNLEESTGIVTWKLEILPGETRSLVITYEVTHPSGRQVSLD